MTPINNLTDAGERLTTLQAIELVKSRPAAEATAEELAGLRELLAKLPSLYPLLGGRDRVDAFCQAAEAAQAAAAQALPEPQAELVGGQPAGDPSTGQFDDRVPAWSAWLDSLSTRRLIEISAFFVVFLWAIVWTASHLVDDGQGGGRKQGQVPAGNQGTNGANTGAAATAMLGPPPEDAPDLQEPPGTWHGWTITADAGAQAEPRSAWDLTNHSTPRPTRRLHTSVGRVTLARKWQLPKEAKSVRILSVGNAAAPGGMIELKINGQTIGATRLPGTDATWVPQITLADFSGKEVDVTLIYTPGKPEEQLEWRDIATSPESLDVMTAAGEIDPGKAALKLWLRADVGAKDPAGRACGSAGAENLVQTWEDQSQQHANFQCGDGAKTPRPTYVPHHANLANHATLAFDGVDDSLRREGAPIYTGTSSTTLVVFQIAGTTANVFQTSAPQYGLLIQNRPRGSRRRSRHASGGGQSISFDAPTRVSMDVSPLNGQFVATSLRVGGGNSQLSVCRLPGVVGTLAGGASGNTFYLGAVPRAAPPTPAPGASPAQPPGTVAPPAAPPPFHLAELLIFDRELSEAELGQLGRYLQAKYGLPGCY